LTASSPLPIARPDRRWAGNFVLGCVAVVIAITGALVPVVGTDFFPAARRRNHQAARAGAARQSSGGTEQILINVEERNPRDHFRQWSYETITRPSAFRAASILAFVRATMVSGADAEI